MTTRALGISTLDEQQASSTSLTASTDTVSIADSSGTAKPLFRSTSAIAAPVSITSTSTSVSASTSTSTSTSASTNNRNGLGLAGRERAQHQPSSSLASSSLTSSPHRHSLGIGSGNSGGSPARIAVRMPTPAAPATSFISASIISGDHHRTTVDNTNRDYSFSPSRSRVRLASISSTDRPLQQHASLPLPYMSTTDSYPHPHQHQHQHQHPAPPPAFRLSGVGMARRRSSLATAGSISAEHENVTEMGIVGTNKSGANLIGGESQQSSQKECQKEYRQQQQQQQQQQQKQQPSLLLSALPTSSSSSSSYSSASSVRSTAQPHESTTTATTTATVTATAAATTLDHNRHSQRAHWASPPPTSFSFSSSSSSVTARLARSHLMPLSSSPMASDGVRINQRRLAPTTSSMTAGPAAAALATTDTAPVSFPAARADDPLLSVSSASGSASASASTIDQLSVIGSSRIRSQTAIDMNPSTASLRPPSRSSNSPRLMHQLRRTRPASPLPDLPAPAVTLGISSTQQQQRGLGPRSSSSGGSAGQQPTLFERRLSALTSSQNINRDDSNNNSNSNSNNGMDLPLPRPIPRTNSNSSTSGGQRVNRRKRFSMLAPDELPSASVLQGGKYGSISPSLVLGDLRSSSPPPWIGTGSPIISTSAAIAAGENDSLAATLSPSSSPPPPIGELSRRNTVERRHRHWHHKHQQQHPSPITTALGDSSTNQPRLSSSSSWRRSLLGASRASSPTLTAVSPLSASASASTALITNITDISQHNESPPVASNSSSTVEPAVRLNRKQSAILRASMQPPSLKFRSSASTASVSTVSAAVSARNLQDSSSSYLLSDDTDAGYGTTNNGITSRNLSPEMQSQQYHHHQQQHQLSSQASLTALTTTLATVGSRASFRSTAQPRSVTYSPMNTNATNKPTTATTTTTSATMTRTTSMTWSSDDDNDNTGEPISDDGSDYDVFMPLSPRIAAASATSTAAAAATAGTIPTTTDAQSQRPIVAASSSISSLRSGNSNVSRSRTPLAFARPALASITAGLDSIGIMGISGRSGRSNVGMLSSSAPPSQQLVHPFSKTRWWMAIPGNDSNNTSTSISTTTNTSTNNGGSGLANGTLPCTFEDLHELASIEQRFRHPQPLIAPHRSVLRQALLMTQNPQELSMNRSAVILLNDSLVFGSLQSAPVSSSDDSDYADNPLATGMLYDTMHAIPLGRVIARKETAPETSTQYQFLLRLRERSIMTTVDQSSTSVTAVPYGSTDFVRRSSIQTDPMSPGRHASVRLTATTASSVAQSLSNVTEPPPTPRSAIIGQPQHSDAAACASDTGHCSLTSDAERGGPNDNVRDFLVLCFETVEDRDAWHDALYAARNVHRIQRQQQRRLRHTNSTMLMTGSAGLIGQPGGSWAYRHAHSASSTTAASVAAVMSAGSNTASATTGSGGGGGGGGSLRQRLLALDTGDRSDDTESDRQPGSLRSTLSSLRAAGGQSSSNGSRRALDLAASSQKQPTISGILSSSTSAINGVLSGAESDTTEPPPPPHQPHRTASAALLATAAGMNSQSTSAIGANAGSSLDSSNNSNSSLAGRMRLPSALMRAFNYLRPSADSSGDESSSASSALASMYQYGGLAGPLESLPADLDVFRTPPAPPVLPEHDIVDHFTGLSYVTASSASAAAAAAAASASASASPKPIKPIQTPTQVITTATPTVEEVPVLETTTTATDAPSSFGENLLADAVDSVQSPSQYHDDAQDSQGNVTGSVIRQLQPTLPEDADGLETNGPGTTAMAAVSPEASRIRPSLSVMNFHPPSSPQSTSLNP